MHPQSGQHAELVVPAPGLTTAGSRRGYGPQVRQQRRGNYAAQCRSPRGPCQARRSVIETRAAPSR